MSATLQDRLRKLLPLDPGAPHGRAALAARTWLQLRAWQPRDPAEADDKRAIATALSHDTMISVDRAQRLLEHARYLTDAGVAGAIVECGTWRGGSLALLDWALRQRDDRRDLWALDSFEGLPPPGPNDGIEARLAFFRGWLAASEQDVERALGRLGGDAGRLRCCKGWIEQTLDGAETGPIALLNIDVDWYEPVLHALRVGWQRLSPGGVINLDDYGRWPGCDRATDAFFAEAGLPRAWLRRTGSQGAWFRKPRGVAG